MGLGPDQWFPLTMRELMLMAMGRIKQEWNYWSQEMCLIANCNRNEEKHPYPFTMADFHPFMEKPADIETSHFDDYSMGMVSMAKHSRFSRFRVAG